MPDDLRQTKFSERKSRGGAPSLAKRFSDPVRPTFSRQGDKASSQLLLQVQERLPFTHYNPGSYDGQDHLLMSHSRKLLQLVFAATASINTPS